MTKITIHGTGELGLVIANGFAALGHQVVCFDIDKNKVERLKRGIVPFYEPQLGDLLHEHLAKGSIAFSNDPSEAVTFGEYQFITVGTPSTCDGSPNLSYLFAAAKNIAQYSNRDTITIIKSTIPVGTTHKIKAMMDEELIAKKSNIKLQVAFVPEFLVEGSAVYHFMHPDRVIIGSRNPKIIEKMYELFKPTLVSEDQFIPMTICSAELTKYAANTFLAMKISFINDMANISEHLGADITQIKKGLGSDVRINPYFLNAGSGYGGSCFSKDIRALIDMEKKIDYFSPLIASIEIVNDRQKHVLFNKVYHYFHGELQGKTLAVWGLAFKPNSSDMRNATSITLLNELWEHGAKVKAYDPEAMPEANALFGERNDLILCEKKEDALIDADALVIVTEWEEFFYPNFDLIKKLLKYRVIFDGRNIYHPEHLKSMGIEYFGIGIGICPVCRLSD